MTLHSNSAITMSSERMMAATAMRPAPPIRARRVVCAVIAQCSVQAARTAATASLAFGCSHQSRNGS